MNTIILEFPKGLRVDISNVLNSISENTLITDNKFMSKVEFVGCVDNWEEKLISVRHYDCIKVVKSN